MAGEDEAGRPKARWRFQAVDALLVVAVAVPALLFGLVATYDRRQTLAAAERDLLATLDTLHGHAEKVFQFQILALNATEEWLRGLSDAAVLAGAAQHHGYLRALWRHSGETLGLVVFGADGHALVESDQPETSRSINVSDRGYFRWHRDNPDPAPLITGPARSLADGRPVFFITLRRSAEDGSFRGVLADGVQQGIFNAFWDRATPSPDSIISLVRTDGTILARRPARDPEALSSPPVSNTLMAAMAAGREHVVMRNISAIDGDERLFAIRRIEQLPVFIAHAVPQSAALAPWRRRLMVYGAFAATAALALFLLTFVVRRRTRDLAELNAHLEQRVAERTSEIQAGETKLRLLAREVDHRAKNALAVVLATLRLTPRHDAAEFAAAVEGRVLALAHAQTLLAADRWRGADLHALLRAELAPFVASGNDPAGARAALDGPPVLLPPVATQPLAMVIHELATNAVKHGALSVPGGRVSVRWQPVRSATAGDGLALRWEEAGGPALAGTPTRRGFGSRILDSTIRIQLGGALRQSWPASGMVCEIDLALPQDAKAMAPALDPAIA